MLVFSLISFTTFSQGGDTPALALSNTTTTSIPFSHSNQSTVGKNNDVSTTVAGLPVGFPTSFVLGGDYFYYICPTVSQNLTITLNYTTSSITPVKPSLLIWDGVPGNALSKVISSIYSNGDADEVTGTLSTTFNAINNKCYYIMIDNWPTPNGFPYTISGSVTPIADGCTNIGFEANTLNDWSATYGQVLNGIISPRAATSIYTPLCSSTTMPTALVSKPQHLITSLGNDPNIGTAIMPMVCPLDGLGNHSLRLGDGNIASGRGATIEQIFAVTIANAMFSYYYAVVMKYDPTHETNEQPMFKINITDENGANITCADYLVVANATDPTFQKYGDIYYKNWTPVFVDLSDYIGKKVKIKYQVGDCAPEGSTTGGTHFAYAYIDAKCSSVTKATTQTACSGVSTVLNAPMGGKTYSWKVQGAATGTAPSSDPTYTVANPTATTIYECTITSVTNCVTTTTVTLNVSPSPVITNPGTQTSCGPFTLTPISGTNLTVGKNYYNNSKANGGTVITGPINSTQTVWIYDTDGTCSDEESFLVKIRTTPLVTVNSPTLCTTPATITANVTPTAAYEYSWAYPSALTTNPGNVANFNTTIPGTYTVTVSNANLLCNSDFEDAQTFSGTSTSILVGNASSPCWKSTAVSSPRVEFWKTNASSGNQYIKVKSSGSTTVFQNFTATPNSEVTLSFAHKKSATSGTETMTVEIGPVGGPYAPLGSYTANAAWTTNTVTYLIPSNALTTYTLRFTSTSSAGNCLDAVSLSIIGCPATPASGVFTLNAITLDNPGPQIVCNSYTLPTITGTNLTGTEKYYINSKASGDRALLTGPINSSKTVWIYDDNGTCSDEESFLVTINSAPIVTVSSSTICNGGTATVTATVNPAGIYKYIWTVPTGVTNPGNVASFTTNKEGDYIVDVTTSNLANKLCNNDFEEPNIALVNPNWVWNTQQDFYVNCWKSTSGKIEFWHSLLSGITAVSGNQFVELNADAVSTLYQEGLTLEAGNIIDISFSHRGRNGTDVMELLIGPPMPAPKSACTVLGSYSSGNTAWSNYTTSYTIPVTGIYSLRFESVSAAGGNITIGNFLDAISLNVRLCPTLPATGTVTLVSNPTASISTTSPICSGTGTNIIFNGTPNGKVTYKIGTGANQFINLNSSGAATLPTGNLTSNTTYNLVSIEIGSAPVCLQNLTGSLTVTVNPLPTANIAGTTAICVGATSPNITFTGANGTAPYTFTYNIGGATNTTVTTTSGN